MKYNIQFGIAPYIKEIATKDVKGQPFSFKFDKTMTKQVKRWYDAYIQCHSKVSKSITTSYCGSLFVGHCSAEDMLEQILKFTRRLGLNTALCIHLGMECLSVNKYFVRKHIGCFEKDHQITFLTLESWALHIVYSAFRKSITDLTMDIDQYACDLHFFL